MDYFATKKVLKASAVLLLLCSHGVSAGAESIVPRATAYPQETATPVLEFSSCRSGESTADLSLIHEKLVGIKSQLSGGNLAQMEESLASFLSASPSLMAGECAAVEAAVKPSLTTLDAAFRDFLGRKAMYVWKYHSGVFGILKKSGVRSNLTCRLGDKPIPNLPTLSGGTNPMWEYCCRMDLCVDELTVPQIE